MKREEIAGYVNGAIEELKELKGRLYREHTEKEERGYKVGLTDLAQRIEKELRSDGKLSERTARKVKSCARIVREP